MGAVTCEICTGARAYAPDETCEDHDHLRCAETGLVSLEPERYWDARCTLCGNGLCMDHLTGTYEYYDDASDSRCTKCTGADA